MPTPTSLQRYVIVLPSQVRDQQSSTTTATASAIRNPTIDWIKTNQTTLSKMCTLLTTPPISDQLALLSAEKTQISSLLEVEALTTKDSSVIDLVVASKILSLSADDILCVIYFTNADDNAGERSSIALNNLVRVSTHRNIPLALNPITANLCLRALVSKQHAILIFNPAAGQRPAEEDLREIRSCLEPAYSLKVVYTERNKDVAEQAKDIVEWIQTKYLCSDKDDDSDRTQLLSQAPMIVASGGDGTVSAIAGATIQSGITVGIVPRGTANAFSVALGIPTNNVQEACQTIVDGFVRNVDGASATISVGGENEKRTISWINHAGLGFEAGLVKNTTRELKDAFGNLGYTIGAAQQILNQRPFQCTFQIDEDPTTEKTLQTSVVTISSVDASSSVFAQGFGQVIPDDGLFEVTIAVIENDGLTDGLESLLALTLNAIVKESVGSRKLLCFRCRKLKVCCTPAQKLLLDGEVIELTDGDSVQFECFHESLTVVAPPTSS